MRVIFPILMIMAVAVCARSVAAQEALQPPITVADRPGRISLDVKGMDVIDVLKMLGTRAGKNLVIGKNVSGRVTLFLKDVDVNDAFEMIILSNDLAYDQKGSIVNVMTQRDYELLYGQRFQDNKEARTIQLRYAKAQDLARALAQMKTNIGRVIVDEASNTVVLMDTPQKVREMADLIGKTDLPLKTQIFSLSYAQADKVGAKLQEAVTKGVGSLKLDERTNKIVVTDYPDRLAEIARIVAAFDERPKQVLIDAQIIEISPSDKFEMGVDWAYWIEKNFTASGALPIGATSRLFIGTPSRTPNEKGEYKAIVDLLRTIGDTKILSSPRIMVLNNQEAKILVGTKDAYITSATSQTGETAVTSQSVNFVDVGIKLYVTPTVSQDGFVTMKIKPEVSSAERTEITSGGQITQIPIVTTSETETTVSVKDGVTIIIAGLRKDERQKTVKKIPILGDIPVLGFIFRSTSDDATQSELIVLLTPHIVEGDTSYTEIGAIRPRDGAVVRMYNGEIVTEKISSGPPAASGTDYYRLVADKARSAASFDRPKSEKGSVKISFTLSREGTLVSEPTVLEADNAALEAPAIKAIKGAVPFPPFPVTLKRDQETFRINLLYN